MSESQTDDGGLQLTLSIWHPKCWTLEVTDETAAGLLAHGVYNTKNQNVKGLFTAYADSITDVDELIEATRESDLTESVLELRERHGATGTGSPPGNTTRELFVEYDPDNTISDSLLSRGFIHNDPVRVRHGREHWPVFFPGTRDEAETAIAEIREEKDADIEVTRITSAGGSNPQQLRRMDRLSDSQREAFELARQEDYYAWPRGISTRELASELGVSKTTLLEHLRKAEAKLLDPDPR
ncbi:helix-turn-helix domain-containing protein [Haloarcula salina]|uniref:helix-turn-helix domain-containing protein n=1 Tax=Haloarcula salina TaxID=1429914 RepID=UPI003C6F7E0C